MWSMHILMVLLTTQNHFYQHVILVEVSQRHITLGLDVTRIFRTKAIEGLWRYGYICRSSSVSRGGGSQNVIAKNKPLLW